MRGAGGNIPPSRFFVKFPPRLSDREGETFVNGGAVDRSEGGTEKGGAAVLAASDGDERSARAADAIRLAGTLPDIRDEKVGPIQLALEAGTYRVEGGKVAGRILASAVQEHRVRAS